MNKQEGLSRGISPPKVVLLPWRGVHSPKPRRAEEEPASHPASSQPASQPSSIKPPASQPASSQLAGASRQPKTPSQQQLRSTYSGLLQSSSCSGAFFRETPIHMYINLNILFFIYLFVVVVFVLFIVLHPCNKTVTGGAAADLSCCHRGAT